MGHKRFCYNYRIASRVNFESLSFFLILDVLTEHIQVSMPRCMLFVDDIILVGESREEINGKLE